MQAVILAAGMGKRLGHYTRNNTKCMVQVNGIKLIDRTMESLSAVGVSRIVMVVGYEREGVKEYLGDEYQGIPIEYVDNEIYDRTNNIYSLYLAKDYLVEEDTILLESDLIYEPCILKRLLEDDYPNIALVDKYESWMDGTVVTLDSGNRITGFIDKEDFKYEEIKYYYKTVNIYKLSKGFLSRYYVPFLEAYSKALGNNEYYEQVLKVILHLKNAPLKALPLKGETWYEIDDIQDLDIAAGMFANTDEEHYSAYMNRYGGYWRYPQMLDYCYLVNPYFPPQKLTDEIKASFDTLIREYPSGMKVNSLLASKNFGVKEDCIIVGNGAAELIKVAAELIKALMEGYVGTLGNVLPTFEEYPNRISGQKSVQYIPKTRDFHYTAGDLKIYFEDKKIDTLLLINPDNPSGNYIPYKELLGLIAWTKEKGWRFVVDESFVDFADVDGGVSLLNNTILAENPHLFVIKSISKSYGVPGLRLGILASGNTEMIAELKKKVAIWNINSFGEFFMQIYEKYKSDYEEGCRLFREEREHFKRELKQIPFLEVFDSQANYFLCEVTDRFKSGELAMKLLRKNILIKDCGGKAAINGRDLIRLAVRSRKDNSYLVGQLKEL